jgi:hypothetical protein
LEVLIEELKAAYRAAPHFGSVEIRAHFADGRMIRFERIRSESMKSEAGS